MCKINIEFGLTQVCCSFLGQKCDSTFSYLRFIDMSVGEQESVHYSLMSKLMHLTRFANRQRNQTHLITWHNEPSRVSLHQITPVQKLKSATSTSWLLDNLLFCKSGAGTPFGFGDVTVHHMAETMEHRALRARKTSSLIQEVHPHVERPPQILCNQPTCLPAFLHSNFPPKVALETPRLMYAHLPKNVQENRRHLNWNKMVVMNGPAGVDRSDFRSVETGGLSSCRPGYGWSNVVVPDKQSLVSDAGKLFVLDGLLSRLKAGGHRVLVYSQMTKMIDLLEEFMVFR